MTAPANDELLELDPLVLLHRYGALEDRVAELEAALRDHRSWKESDRTSNWPDGTDLELWERTGTGEGT